ncbi:hypothetical protein FHX82_002705 [Amycolatopsis bartoniae]|nr:hypothetical protein [Amycolatopsis bartoniae]
MDFRRRASGRGTVAGFGGGTRRRDTAAGHGGGLRGGLRRRASVARPGGASGARFGGGLRWRASAARFGGHDGGFGGGLRGGARRQGRVARTPVTDSRSGMSAAASGRGVRPRHLGSGSDPSVSTAASRRLASAAGSSAAASGPGHLGGRTSTAAFSGRHLGSGIRPRPSRRPHLHGRLQRQAPRQRHPIPAISTAAPPRPASAAAPRWPYLDGRLQRWAPRRRHAVAAPRRRPDGGFPAAAPGPRHLGDDISAAAPRPPAPALQPTTPGSTPRATPDGSHLRPRNPCHPPSRG